MALNKFKLHRAVFIACVLLAGIFIDNCLIDLFLQLPSFNLLNDTRGTLWYINRT